MSLPNTLCRNLLLQLLGYSRSYVQTPPQEGSWGYAIEVIVYGDEQYQFTYDISIA